MNLDSEEVTALLRRFVESEEQVAEYLMMIEKHWRADIEIKREQLELNHRHWEDDVARIERWRKEDLERRKQERTADLESMFGAFRSPDAPKP